MVREAQPQCVPSHTNGCLSELPCGVPATAALAVRSTAHDRRLGGPVLLEFNEFSRVAEVA